jgi:hypothetical protein
MAFLKRSTRRDFGAWYLRCLLGLGFGGWSFSAFPQPAATQPSREYKIKAAFLFNFAQFTEWPAKAFADKEAPLVFGVLGRDPFGSILDDTLRGEQVQGRRLLIQRYSKVEEIKSCHILYIGQSEANNLDPILTALKDKPVLTVSDIEGSAWRGVMIRFLTERNKIRFRINLAVVRAANLTLSSKLLRAAEVIGTEKK